MTALAVDLGVCAIYERHRHTGETRTCTAPAVARVVAGCVHEHVISNLLCARHLKRLQGNRTNCESCFESADPHWCKVLGRVIASPPTPQTP